MYLSTGQTSDFTGAAGLLGAMPRVKALLADRIDGKPEKPGGSGYVFCTCAMSRAMPGTTKGFTGFTANWT